MRKKRGMTPIQASKIRVKKNLEETKLQKIRVKRGLSQSELAEISGIPLRSLQEYEQQRTIDNAKLNTLCKLCIALNCKLEDILESKELIAKLKITK